MIAIADIAMPPMPPSAFDFRRRLFAAAGFAFDIRHFIEPFLDDTG